MTVNVSVLVVTSGAIERLSDAVAAPPAVKLIWPTPAVSVASTVIVSGWRGSICAPAVGDTMRTTGAIASVTVTARDVYRSNARRMSKASAVSVSVPAAAVAGTETVKLA